MKRISLVLWLLCCIVGTAAYSQTYYYSTNKTIAGDGFVYKCDNLVGSVTLYNSENQFTYDYMHYKDGSLMKENHPRFMINDQLNDPKVRDIITNSFTSEEKTRLKAGKARFMFVLTISPETGKVIEVHYWFLDNKLAATIPVKKYRAIELSFKANIQFTITAEGKKMNYLTYGFIYHFDDPTGVNW